MGVRSDARLCCFLEENRAPYVQVPAAPSVLPRFRGYGCGCWACGPLGLIPAGHGAGADADAVESVLIVAQAAGGSCVLAKFGLNHQKHEFGTETS